MSTTAGFRYGFCRSTDHSARPPGNRAGLVAIQSICLWFGEAVEDSRRPFSSVFTVRMWTLLELTDAGMRVLDAHHRDRGELTTARMSCGSTYRCVLVLRAAQGRQTAVTCEITREHRSSWKPFVPVHAVRSRYLRKLVPAWPHAPTRRCPGRRSVLAVIARGNATRKLYVLVSAKNRQGASPQHPVQSGGKDRTHAAMIGHEARHRRF